MTEKKTAHDRWKAIPYQTRVVWLYIFLLFVMGAGIVARPDTAVNRNLTDVTGYAPDVIAVCFWLMIPLMGFTYTLWRNMFAVLIPLAPLFAYVFILLQQIAGSKTAPMVHGAMGLSVVVFVLALYYLAEELDEKQQVIEGLKATRTQPENGG